MRQFVTIAINAFMELIRQPVLLLLMSASAVFAVYLAGVPYFGFGDDPKLVKLSMLAVMLLAGLLGAVLCASNSLAREIHTGTALAVLAKPVNRATFVLAKYVGIAGALAVVNYVNLVAVLYGSRMAFDAYGDPDLVGLLIWCLAVGLAFAAGGFSNYFTRRPFVPAAVLAVVVFVTLAFVINGSMSKPDPTSRNLTIGPFERVDWGLIPAGLLILFAVWTLAALAVLCSTRLELMSTLAVCSTVFLLGLMSDYLFGRPAQAGAWWAKVLYVALPDWQLFWVADALQAGKSIPLAYLWNALGYMATYVAAALGAALFLFEDRELV